ncbi:MAG: 30S ribosomal protein S16 [Spirochaetales bacterium]|nr:MAG: 30S ribosomal protein S16 [Spirochaetales bacterium]
MAVKIRLKRFGTKKRPYCRIVVMDAKTPRDGRAIEEVGFYHPIEVEDRQIQVKAERIKEWLKQGAQPTDTVKRMLNKINLKPD